MLLRPSRGTDFSGTVGQTPTDRSIVTMSFTEIPILDLSLARRADTKLGFLTDLRSALLNVGFLYLKNTGIEQEICDEVCREGIAFFDLPDEEKLTIEMKQQPSFLGYSRVSCLSVCIHFF